MAYSFSTTTKLREIFKDVCKIIYADIDYTLEFTDEEHGKFVSNTNIPFIVDMIFYLLMSQYFKKIKIKFAGELTDLRTSIFEIRPSRTGKGQMIKIIEEAGKNLGLKTKRISYLNQASLIGSINEFNIEYNSKNRLTRGMKGFRDPVMYGALKNTDILIFPEAKKLVKGVNEADTEFILSTLQEALDYPGIINKELRYTDYPINYESTVSIFSATYYVTEIADLLLDQGFFQRNLIDKKNFTLEETKKLRRMIIEKYRNKEANKDFGKKMKEFCNMITTTYKNDERIIEFTDEAVDYLQKYNDAYFDFIKNISGKELEILKSFSQTIIHMITKIGGINCCLRDDNKIIVQDLSPSIKLFHDYIKILTTQLMVQEKKGSDVENYKRTIIQCYKDFIIKTSKNPNKDELRQACNKSGLGSNKSQKLINIMIEENYFVVKDGEHNSQELRLVEN